MKNAAVEGGNYYTDESWTRAFSSRKRMQKRIVIILLEYYWADFLPRDNLQIDVAAAEKVWEEREQFNIVGFASRKPQL